jgi:predicted RNase H-like HicB family nuclease
VTYTTADARQHLLDTLAGAVGELAVALSALGEAYEALDEHKADELEERLFRPLQSAYGRARRTHSEFAQRHALPTRTFDAAPAGAPSHGAKGFVTEAGEAVARAEQQLSSLQDSMLPVEVGDPELRAGLREVRQQLAPLPAGARDFLRTFGR